MIRALFVTTSLPPERGGGAEAYAIQLSAALEGHRFEVDVLGRNGGHPDTVVETVGRGRWVRLGTHVHPYFSYLLAVRRWLRVHASDYDVIQFFDMNVVSAAGLGATKGTGVPRVLRDEQVIEWSDAQLSATRVPLLAQWARRQLMTADRYVAVSSAEVAVLKTRGIPEELTTFIPNGIDVSRFPLQPFGSEPVVLCPARLRPEKNHTGLLRAFARVVEAVPDASLILAGDGPERARVESMVADLGLRGRVELLGHVEDMVALYRRARMVSLLSTAEGPSLGVLEGASCGRPAVVSDLGGLTDSVVDGGTGLRVSPGDAPAAAQAIVRLLRDEALCRRMGLASARFVRAERSLDECARRYSEYLRMVVRSSAALRASAKGVSQ